VRAQQPNALGQRVVVGDDRTALADSEVLVGEERERARGAESAEVPPLMPHADRVSGVLEQDEPARLAQVADRPELARGGRRRQRPLRPSYAA
jgi:hypothetical protein